MITSIKLEDWKSFSESTLHVDSLTVLIGTNASGKSNALDAFSFLNKVASGALLTSALQGDSALKPLRGGIEWAARKPGKVFSISVTCRADISTDYEYRVECCTSENRCDLLAENLTRYKYRLDKKGNRKSISGTIKLIRTDPCDHDSPTIVARLYNEKQGTPRNLSRNHTVLFQLASQKLRQEINDGISTVIEALRDIFILDPISSHMRSYSALSETLEADGSNIAGVIAALPRDKENENEIEAALSNYASQLPERDIKRVYAETVGKFNTDAMLYCEEHWANEKNPPTIDARGMSDGTLRFLAILTALLTRPKNSLLIVEEVDNGLHPSRAKLLIDVLKDIGGTRGVDVLVTTHNPALLDAMGNEMVPFICVAHRDPNSGASVLTLLEEIHNLPKLLSQGKVGKLSSSGMIEKTLQAQMEFDFADKTPKGC